MEQGRINRTSGMGGFLNPPGHPEHTTHVETDLRKSPENRGGMSLSAAATSDWLDTDTRAQAARVLSEWEHSKLPLDDAQVQAWVRQVLGYFRGCYRSNTIDGREWDAQNLIIDQNRDPLEYADLHAGLRFIRKFYPEFTATAIHFDEAKWGR